MEPLALGPLRCQLALVIDRIKFVGSTAEGVTTRAVNERLHSIGWPMLLTALRKTQTRSPG
jgi:hypothetical protein